MDNRLHVRNIVQTFTYRLITNSKSEIMGMWSIRTSNPLRGLNSENSSSSATLHCCFYLRQRIYASLSVQHSCDNNMQTTHFIYTHI